MTYSLIFLDNLARLEVRQVISDYVIAKNKKKGNKGEQTRRTRGETAKYCFSILLAGDDGETRCQQCFQKKYTTPAAAAAAPARGMTICIFSTPFSFPAVIVISFAPMANAGLANFETKTSAESKTKFVLCLFCDYKQV